MSFTPSAGITGPQAHQNAFDIPRINKADVDRSAQRAKRSTFSDLLNETILKASRPAPHVSQTGDVQAGHSLRTGRTSPGMSRGKIVSTGNPLHMAIEGEGSFVLTDGQRNLYTRTGLFAVNENLNLVDPATGYRVKRIGSEGEIDGFQTPGSSNIRIPYGMAIPAKATSEIAVSGNLSADTSYFEISTPGSEASSSIDITVYDSQGDRHVLSGAFVRTNVPHKWDMVLTSVKGDTGNITMQNQRIKGITFDPDNGSYRGLSDSSPAQFVVTFANDASDPQTIRINLGNPARLDGLTGFAGNSTAAVKNQDGYGPGRLSTVSANSEGAVVGVFSNGIKKNIAAVQIATFQDASALERLGNGYYIPSAGSGMPVVGRAMANGAGAIRSGALERSDSDVAADFASMTQARYGNPANEILRELTSFIR
ncbi:MAG: flagellar hook-basal body complex protein [Phycisphaerae bacterium]|nr:flagellar hook-basal body complex protein [Phycisphaerae bacterium]